VQIVEMVSDVVTALYRALTEADTAWFEERVRDPSVHIGIGVGHWNDRSGLIEALVEQAAEMTGDMAATWLSSSGPVVDQMGDVAWVADRPLLRFDDSSELRCRVTFVFVREHGRWVLAQSHLSLGTDVADGE
jgi:hypothetical protein